DRCSIEAAPRAAAGSRSAGQQARRCTGSARRATARDPLNRGWPGSGNGEGETEQEATEKTEKLQLLCFLRCLLFSFADVLLFLRLRLAAVFLQFLDLGKRRLGVL